MELKYLGNAGLPHLIDKIKALLNSKADADTSVQYINNTLSVDGESLTPQKIGCAPSDYLNVVYPVGSLYMSSVPVKPSTLFGGTWEEVRVLISEDGNENYYTWKRTA